MISKFITILDGFGKYSPRKMPGHFFRGNLHLDYSTAIKADITKQDFSACPRHWYIDVAFRCAQCNNTFVFSAEEQRFWYEELGFYVDSGAKHCRACRGELRTLQALRQEYDRDVAAALAINSRLEQKKRVIEVVDALDQGGVKLPDKIHDNRRLLAKQVEQLRSSEVT